MKLNRNSPLSLALGTLIIWIVAFVSSCQGYTNQNIDGWIPIASRYEALKKFVFETVPSRYSELPQINQNNDNTHIVSKPQTKELIKNQIHNGNGYHQVHSLESAEALNRKGYRQNIRQGKLQLGVDTTSNTKYIEDEVITMNKPVMSSTADNGAWTPYPEVGFDVPFISNSEHATNKSDATAYYPRPNDYNGTRARRLRLDSGLNENIDVNPKDSLNSKWNHLYSEKRIFDEKAKIEKKRNAAANYQLSLSRNADTDDRKLIKNKYVFNDNINDEINQHKMTKIHSILNHEIPAAIETNDEALQFKPHENVDKKLKVENDNPVASNDSSTQYSQSKGIFLKHEKPNLISKLLNTFNKYNVDKEALFTNYDISRSALHGDVDKTDTGYKYGPSIDNRKLGFNNLNHLPIDPVLAVILSHYGYYIPGYNGRYINYRNIYGYLASNNIHNNKPFGSYKLFSDTHR